MIKLWLDTETYSGTLIKNGLPRYFAAPDFDVLLVTYAINDGEVQLWDRTLSKTPPADLLDALASPDARIYAHNVAFDYKAVNRAGIVPLKHNLSLPRWVCTATQARAHGLPGGLAELCAAMGVEQEGSKKDGSRFIRLFSMPQADGTRRTRETDPEDWAGFCDYAKHDIVAMRKCAQRMPNWNYPGLQYPDQPAEAYRDWLLHSDITDRGAPVDRLLARNAVALSAQARVNARTEMLAATDGAVSAGTQRDELLNFIMNEYGIELPDLTKSTVERRLEDDTLPEPVRELLLLRLSSAKNTAAKFTALLNAVSADGRLRDTLTFMGATATGRVSGKVFQPQNLMRPTLKQPEIDRYVEHIRQGVPLDGDIPTLLANCIRPVVRASKGYRLIASDLSAIEARLLAWLADDPFLRTYDNPDADAYKVTYANAFNLETSAVTPDLRQRGKAMLLGLGYGGGVGAFVTFARSGGLKLDVLSDSVCAVASKMELAAAEEKYAWAKEHNFHAGLPMRQYITCEYLKTKWRNSRDETVRFWDMLETALRNASLSPGKVFAAGRKIAIRTDDEWTRIRLPSGRCITLARVKTNEQGELTYWGWNKYAKQMETEKIYGGKLAGWVTQGTARDILTAALPRIEAAGYPIIMTVHDEVVVEVPEMFGSVEELNALMSAGEPWTTGLPLAAEGWAAATYRK